jgi:hypothetical protein
VNTQVATKADSAPRARRSVRAIVLLTIGPMAVLAGFVWALFQPYRVTFLDPAGQGFWWLVAQPPLYVMAAGVFFHIVIAPGIVADLEEQQ